MSGQKKINLSGSDLHVYFCCSNSWHNQNIYMKYCLTLWFFLYCLTVNATAGKTHQPPQVTEADLFPLMDFFAARQFTATLNTNGHTSLESSGMNQTQLNNFAHSVLSLMAVNSGFWACRSLELFSSAASLQQNRFKENDPENRVIGQVLMYRSACCNITPSPPENASRATRQQYHKIQLMTQRMLDTSEYHTAISLSVMVAVPLVFVLICTTVPNP